MECSNDKSVEVDNENEETNPNKEDEDSTSEKEYKDFEEFNSNKLLFLFHKYFN